MSVILKKIDIAGEKIRLRPIRAADAEAAYKLVKNEAVVSTLAWDGPSDKEELRDTYTGWEEEIRNGDSYNLVIEEVDQPGLIGCIDIRFPRHPLQADIGYWLGEPFWDKGYVTEAVGLACHLAFKYLGAARAYATVFVGNTGSRRALEKNGFSLDGTLRSHVYKRGEWKDGWFFTLLRDEWERNRGKFTPEYEDVVAVEKEE
ncbi:GNAT family N-acetyltransferase [Chloroflexota bacterium]